MTNSPKPLFVYGTLKSNEIAYEQIWECVDQVVPATLENFALYLRDGIPLVVPAMNWKVKGELLFPKLAFVEKLRERVHNYEGDRLYERRSVEVLVEHESLMPCDVYVGKNFSSGNAEPLFEPWSSSQDPIFSESFPALYVELRRLLVNPLIHAQDEYDWAYYNELAAKLLLLVTVIERLAYLRYAETYTVRTGDQYADRVMARIKKLGSTEAFFKSHHKAKASSALYPVSVYDSRTASSKLSTDNERHALLAWYQVRSNLQHRGKAAWRDFGILQKSLAGLANTTKDLLCELIPSLQSQTKFQEIMRLDYVRLPGE